MDVGESLIAGLERSRREAIIAADKAALGELLSDHLIWTHANGVTEDKTTYIAAQGTKARFTAIEVVKERIALYGEAAAVVSEFAMTIKPAEGDAIKLRTTASSVWAKEGEAWRLVRFHSGMIS